MYLDKLKRRLKFIQVHQNVARYNKLQKFQNKVKIETGGMIYEREGFITEKNVASFPTENIEINNSFIIAYGENAQKINLNGIIDPKKIHVHHLHDKELSFHFMKQLVHLQGKKNILFLNKCLPIISELPQEEKSNVYLYSVG